MTLDGARMGRRIAAGAAATAVALAGAGCAAKGGEADPPVLVAPAGSAGLLSTSQGAIWSFQRGNGGYGVLRSKDNGQTWQVVLPQHGRDLVASYFLGPGRAWIVDRKLNKYGQAKTTVLGTKDGGKSWWRSAPLPGDKTSKRYVPHDQVYFSDPMHGWVLATGTRVGPPSAGPLPEGVQHLQLWRTSNGGLTWTRLPSKGLPLQGLSLAGVGKVQCANQPAITFANPVDGWLVQGSCGSGNAKPLVWRTTDGGRRWRPVPLRKPVGGWGEWARGRSTPASSGATVAGTDVGQAKVVAWGIHAMLLVPVAVKSSVIIERSDNGGETWRIAATVRTGTLPSGSAPDWWFDPIDARDWVLSVPGRLIETADMGQHWTFTRSPVSLPRAPASFLNLDHGVVQGTGTVAVLRTGDHGKKWLPEQAPAWSGTRASVVGPAISTVQIVTRHLAVAAGAAGLETSTDGGRRWKVRFSVPGPVRKVEFVGPKVGFALAGGELLRSRDAGATWYPIRPPIAGPVSDVDFWTARAGIAHITSTGAYYLTRDAGKRWRPLMLPAGWTAQPSGLSMRSGSAAACFVRGGTGWVVAEQAHRVGVLVTADGGRHWRTALKPGALPRSQAIEESAGLAGCGGSAAWVLVTITDERRGDALTYDLLRTSDLGRTWQDVLRTPTGSAPRPAVPLVPAAQFSPAWTGKSARLRSLALGSAGSVFATFTGGSGADLDLSSTADPSVGWSWHEAGRSADPQQLAGSLPGSRRWLATCALNSERAWVLLAGPARSGASFLFATRDGGATWHVISTFRPVDVPHTRVP